MSKWSGSETGILRKPIPKDKFEDLLVFGYACKVFRDDEKALYIDQGKHLIPWMGDSSLKIDRYDCRGALSEIKQYECNDHDASRWLGLNESDRRAEMMCDEERYYALKYNEEELEMYQEEETKRLQEKGTEFQYNYDVPGNPEQVEGPIQDVEQDEPFVPPPELNLPSDMEVPKTVKENARIEKTAMFVSSEGPQMEILIKTKQADNSQFFFMNKDNSLYKYYKFLLTAIKSGQYKAPTESSITDKKTDEVNEQDDQEEYYLHPSLVASTQPAQPPPPPLPTVIYKPSADCAYTQLVSRIQGTQSESATPPPLPEHPTAENQMTYEQQQYYHQYYYAAQYYEYYKQMSGQFTAQNPGQLPNNVQDPGYTLEQFYALCQNQTELQQNHSLYQQYVQQSTNPYAQLVSNLSQVQGKETNDVPPENLNDIAKAPILYTKPESEPPPTTPMIGPQLPTAEVVQKETITQSSKINTIQMPLLSIAQYGSDTEDECDTEIDNIKTPPTDLQQIIDRMAVYVSKNGKDFENIVRAKGDQRFQFLNDDQEFNAYYKMKLVEYSTNGVQENGSDKVKEKKIIAPVSFSIKKPKDELPKEIKSALPVEESDEEMDDSAEAAPKTPPPIVVPPSVPDIPNQSLTPPLKEPPPSPVITEQPTKPEETPQSISNNPIKQLDNTEDLLEMIDITDDLERREIKRVENSKMDRITAVVRERLALQLERKKKAAAFLKLKSSGPELDSKTDQTPVCANSLNHSKPKKVKSCKNDVKVLQKSTNNNTLENTKPIQQIIVDEIINIEDSDLEEGEIKKHKKSSKKKKSHKRKRSKSRHESKSSRHKHKSKEHKKSRKRHKKSESYDSETAISSE